MDHAPTIALLAAPTNLGLRPPQPSRVPGCAKAPEALREAGLYRRMLATGAVDAGVVHLSGYWLHLDVDVLDPEHMPAMDSPDAGGSSPEELTTLLAALAPTALGAHVTVFDPDLDPDGRYADLLTEVLATGLRDLGSARA